VLRHILITLAMFVAAGLAQAGEAGRIVFVTGQAQVGARAVTLDDVVQEGDELTTGADGYLYMKTVDNGFLILRPDTRARIVAYRIDGANPANTRIKLELINGVARSISGDAVKRSRQNFRFNTPVAAIGVRGTDFTVFTDEQTSRVTVLSGGIVVSGFGGGCGPEGGGPCEGASSRELFADQAGQLLQIRKGQIAPQLLRTRELAPDMNAPPRKDEPAVKKTSVGEFTLEPQKRNNLLAGTPLPAPAPAPLPAPAPEPAPAPPPLEPVVQPPPIVAAPKPPEVLWGRWEPVAQLPADDEALAKLRSGDYAAASILNSFFISRINNSEFVLPRDGRASFGLTGSEAYLQAAGQAPVAATVENGRLEVDFAAQSFITSLTVTAPGAQTDIRAKGDLTVNGELVSSVFGSNATVRGYLGGADANEAAYIFNNVGTSPIGAFGATRWGR
jgi:hypothetical protein